MFAFEMKLPGTTDAERTMGNVYVNRNVPHYKRQHYGKWKGLMVNSQSTMCGAD